MQGRLWLSIRKALGSNRNNGEEKKWRRDAERVHRCRHGHRGHVSGTKARGKEDAYLTSHRKKRVNHRDASKQNRNTDKLQEAGVVSGVCSSLQKGHVPKTTHAVLT